MIMVKKGFSVFMIIFFVYMWFPLCYIPQFTEEVEILVSKEYLLSTEEIFHKHMKIDPAEFYRNIKASRSRVTIEELKSNIIDIVGERTDYFSLIYYEVDTKDSIEINSDYLFRPASTYKIPLNMLLYDKAFNDEVDMNSSMVYYSGDYEDGAGELQGSDMLNSPITLTTLSEYSIIYSDNIAANMLVRNLGYYNLMDYMEEISGIEIENGNFIEPEIMLEFLKKLYYNVEDNPYYDSLIEYMKNTIFHDRIDALIPHDIVAHKIGDYGDYANDVGIVYTDKPYIVIFYTEGFGYESIAEISKMLYDFNIQK